MQHTALLCLQVIMALGEKGREHVPYRSSKLTHVLRDSLGGNCATTLVANVWADPAQLDETLSTCRFAQRMTRVTCEISANVVQDTSSRVGGGSIKVLPCLHVIMLPLYLAQQRRCNTSQPRCVAPVLCTHC